MESSQCLIVDYVTKVSSLLPTIMSKSNPETYVEILS